MQLVRKRSNSDPVNKTNQPDWSTLIPVLPGEGPRTRALYLAIRQLIEAGSVPAGAKLPTSRDLATRLGMARGAVVAAFETLIADGFAEARVGAGTYVAASVPLLVVSTPRPGRETDVYRPAPGTLGPGALGVQTPDARTLKIFRGLVSRHLGKLGAQHFAYGDPRGGQALREAIATYLRSARGVRCTADDIIVTSGTQQGLDLFIRAILRAGETVWVEDPCYPMARAALNGNGLRVAGVPIDAEGLDPERGEMIARDARAVYVTPSHQFPLGVAMTMRRRLALIDWAKRNDAWIIEDDYDSEFRFAGSPLTALQGVDDAGRVVYLGTFSKVLFPGLRVGYLVVPQALRDDILALRSRTDRYPATLLEGPLTDFIRDRHSAAHLRRARRQTLAARDALVAALKTNSRLDVQVPDQGLHLLARLPDGSDDVALVERAAAAGVGARALSRLYVDAEPSQGLVIGFSGYSADVMGDAGRKIASLA
ncbi:HTH-type transcriptional regulatory protein GabR [Variibacter gotjawalensis]|uniref:HTH-type transcriptional regulatory protein GabR n=2 Tax=Variibacter gotjawalensis TaxID=1333996 RepID=A0A0S3PZB9_9BRAD|nr:PLP-dependent aminotransferase family protein [Variibacter gotjawalensis]RZS49011.1 GntR family transcriptional regulator [Variibacter gotjawalensis]BAT61271.1 HTH-type transcriptional regulatory protein GabR [Variibacter gotjawalensis]